MGTDVLGSIAGMILILACAFACAEMAACSSSGIPRSETARQDSAQSIGTGAKRPSTSAAGGKSKKPAVKGKGKGGAGGGPSIMKFFGRSADQ